MANAEQPSFAQLDPKAELAARAKTAAVRATLTTVTVPWQRRNKEKQSWMLLSSQHAPSLSTVRFRVVGEDQLLCNELVHFLLCIEGSKTNYTKE